MKKVKDRGPIDGLISHTSQAHNLTLQIFLYSRNVIYEFTKSNFQSEKFLNLCEQNQKVALFFTSGLVSASFHLELL